MKRNAIIGINVAWATVCAGAFFIGRSATPDTPGSGGGDAGTGSFAEGRGSSGGLSALSPEGTRANAGGVRGGGSGGSADLSTASLAQQLTAALDDSDPIRRKALIANVLTNLTLDKVDEVLLAFEEAPRSDEKQRQFRDFLFAWGRMAGAEAVAYALDPESKLRGSYGSTSAIKGWAANDPQGARDFVDTVEDAGTRQWMRYGVMSEMVDGDLAGAIAYAEENDRSRARGMQLDKLVGAITEQRGVEGLAEWAMGIDHTSEANDLLSYKTYAVSATLDKMAADDPQAAADWITQHAGEPYLTADGLERAARRAAGPINEELDWLTKLPEIEGQRHAIGERFEDYIREDFAAAGEWLAAQPLGPTYDEAIEDYARSAAGDDREAALAWAERITDPERRARTIERINSPTPRRG